MNLTCITLQMQDNLKVLTDTKITHILGGRKSKANTTLELKIRTTIQFLHDFYGYFDITDFSELEIIKFKIAKDYILNWYPSFNYKNEIDMINRGSKYDVLYQRLTNDNE